MSPMIGSELIQVTTEERTLDLTDFTVIGSSTVNNSKVTTEVCAIGIGTITIRDQHGHILWEYEKTTPGEECYEVQLTLPDGVGNYTLTATITDGDQSDSMSLDVTYEAVVVSPGTPDTGYLYIGGYAFSASTMLLSVVIIVPVVIFALLRRAKKAAKPVQD